MRKLNTSITRSFTVLVTGLAAAAIVAVSAPAAHAVPETDSITESVTFSNTGDRVQAAARPNREAPRLAVPMMVRGEPMQSRNMKVTFSNRGVAASAYVGPEYDKRYESIRQCIVERESSGVYPVQGGGGNNYYGAYQMSDALADGAAWMMMPTLKKEVGKAKAKQITAHLRATPANKWSRYWQDRAFWTIWNHGKGAAHWAGGRWHC